jgi:hypothetical protein
VRAVGALTTKRAGVVRLFNQMFEKRRFGFDRQIARTLF